MAGDLRSMWSRRRPHRRRSQAHARDARGAGHLSTTDRTAIVSERTLEFIRTTRRQLADNDGFQTAIAPSGRIIGVAGFHGVDWSHRSTSIGYWLAEDQQGQGIMTRTV